MSKNLLKLFFILKDEDKAEYYSSISNLEDK